MGDPEDDATTAADIVGGVLRQAAPEVCGRVAVLLGAMEGRTLGARKLVEATGINYPNATYALLVMRLADLARSTAIDNNVRVAFRLTARGEKLLATVRAVAGTTP